MGATETCMNHPALVAIGDCNGCGRPVCVQCGTTVEGKFHCTSCRPELADRAETARSEEGKQQWFAIWSILLWAIGVLALAVSMILPESSSDEVYEIVFLGLVSLPVGLGLGLLGLRAKSQKHRGKATVGVVLNSITLGISALLIIIGAALTLE